MKSLLLIVLPLVFLSFHNRPVLAVMPSEKITDTSVVVFNDASYKLTLHVEGNDDGYDDSNAVLTLVHKVGRKSTVLLRDTLSCQQNNITFGDFNGDGIKDILIFNVWDVRSNETYYLYLVNMQKKKLIRVKGFEEICNPQYQSWDSTIYSYVSAAADYYMTYKINKKNRVIVVDGPTEDTHQPN
jgi:hypothetical protein